jgi:hypothetical protein
MWLDKQLALAARFAKPVIGVLPQNGGQFPDVLAAHVDAIVPRDAAQIIATLDRLRQGTGRSSSGLR